MNEVHDFSTIQNRYKYTLTVKLTAPLHIGGNFDDANETDLPVIKTAGGKPYIPGSSLKGIFRTASERLSHLLPEAATVCFLDEGGCGQKHHKEIRDILELTKTEKAAYGEIYKLICPVCQTYGTGSIGSKIKFDHVVFEPEKVKLRLRDGIAVNRETGTVKPKAKFDYEVVEIDEPFELTFEAENLEDKNHMVIALALAQLKQGIMKLGGLQARGLGEIKLQSGTVSKYDFTDREKGIKQLLGTLKPAEQDIDQYIEDAISRMI